MNYFLIFTQQLLIKCLLNAAHNSRPRRAAANKSKVLLFGMYHLGKQVEPWEKQKINKKINEEENVNSISTGKMSRVTGDTGGSFIGWSEGCSGR